MFVKKERVRESFGGPSKMNRLETEVVFRTPAAKNMRNNLVPEFNLHVEQTPQNLLVGMSSQKEVKLNASKCIFEDSSASSFQMDS